jgi:hypothetical protein
MPKQTKRESLVLKSKALLILAVLAVCVAASAKVVYASTIYFISESYGETYWLSCGSSAGNYVALCNANGCTVDQGTAQQEADMMCAERGHLLVQ